MSDEECFNPLIQVNDFYTVEVIVSKNTLKF